MSVKLQGGKVILKEGRVSCSCCCGDLIIDTQGGDEGYLETFDLLKSSNAYSFLVTFTAFFVADRLIISTDKGPVYDSGCIGTELGQPSSVTANPTIQANASTVTIQVIPLCGPSTEGTAWIVFLEKLCIKLEQ